MSNFFPVRTQDGSLSLYNNEVNDVYHSKIGAYTEALNKFTLPSGILDFVRDNNVVNILDVCYGLGYNSRVSLSEIRKINPECKVNITAIEFDAEVLLFNLINQIKDENNKDSYIIESAISRLVKDIQHQPKIKDILEDLVNLGCKDIPEPHSRSRIHNTYYMSIPFRISSSKKCSSKGLFLNFEAYINDLRTVIPSLSKKYDFIFYDAFTPSKVPEQWSLQLFEKLYTLLNDNGAYITYASAAPVRQALIEAGFYIGRTKPIGKKSSGTIAYKKSEKIDSQLTCYEQGLLDTRSAISYKDNDFALTREKILYNHKYEQLNSDKISTSMYIKNNNRYF